MESEQGDSGTKWTWRTPLNTLRDLRSKLPAEDNYAQPEPVMAQESDSDLMLVLQCRPAWEIQAYLRFARLPYRVENCAFMGSEAVGLYPALTDGQFVLPAEHAISHISSRRRDLDGNLTKAQKAEAQAFELVVREGLQPLLRILRYKAGEGDAMQTVHAPMKRALYWPLTAWCTAAEKRRSEQEASLRGLRGLAKEELVERARTLYSALDVRLDKDEPYFFGPEPTSVDACIFGHLAEAWTSAASLDFLPAFKNLSRFFRHISNEYFRSGSSLRPEGAGEASASDGRLDGDGAEEGSASDAGGEVERASGVAEGELDHAIRRADYVNSRNAFNQLEDYALNAEVPYIEDPHVEQPLQNAGIPTPLLPGGTLQIGPSSRAGDSLEDRQTPDETLTLKYTLCGTAVVLLLSMFFSRELRSTPVRS